MPRPDRVHHVDHIKGKVHPMPAHRDGRLEPFGTDRVRGLREHGQAVEVDVQLFRVHDRRVMRAHAKRNAEDALTIGIEEKDMHRGILPE